MAFFAAGTDSKLRATLSLTGSGEEIFVMFHIQPSRSAVQLDPACPGCRLIVATLWPSTRPIHV
ncbi:hypothetical protein A9Y76_26925 (plasmid) [Ralstonia insidiosa]|jgi:hypothetical protein|uniref:Uncharacterized protein n=1 Tax=Ralstonia insidiosa TaxID=190721 RepID=A0A192A6Y4_9RALS|nr:hypothetical protein A9Y76_26925 [Ralstonia insidiosa]KMW44892.1 hypothetical protein AC240_23340 [Ralstonia sp. MD27]MBA9846777.1 hypothetical protein [Ralstonia pickettii]MBA9852071.1 hypothetical protein [Ralstonia pickettii]MBA9869568.1 hypothetical protein [Ralstonia insidiosa]